MASLRDITSARLMALPAGAAGGPPLQPAPLAALQPESQSAGVAGRAAALANLPVPSWTLGRTGRGGDGRGPLARGGCCVSHGLSPLALDTALTRPRHCCPITAANGAPCQAATRRNARLLGDGSCSAPCPAAPTCRAVHLRTQSARGACRLGRQRQVGRVPALPPTPTKRAAFTHPPATRRNHNVAHHRPPPRVCCGASNSGA